MAQSVRLGHLTGSGHPLLLQKSVRQEAYRHLPKLVTFGVRKSTRKLLTMSRLGTSDRIVANHALDVCPRSCAVSVRPTLVPHQCAKPVQERHSG